MFTKASEGIAWSGIHDDDLQLHIHTEKWQQKTGLMRRSKQHVAVGMPVASHPPLLGGAAVGGLGFAARSLLGAPDARR